MSDVRWSRGRAAVLGIALIAALAILLGITSSRRSHADTPDDHALRTIGNADGPDSPDLDKQGGGPGGKGYGKGGPGGGGGGGAPANPPVKPVDEKGGAEPTGRQ